MSTSRCILCISFVFSLQERAWVLNVCFSHPSTLFSSGVSAYLSLVSAFRCSLFSFFTLLSSRRVYNLARYSEEINVVYNSRFIYSNPRGTQKHKSNAFPFTRTVQTVQIANSPSPKNIYVTFFTLGRHVNALSHERFIEIQVKNAFEVKIFLKYKFLAALKHGFMKVKT